MEKVSLLEPELIGLPKKAIGGFGQGWREIFGRALRRPWAKPIDEDLALEKALNKAHLHQRLDERRWNGNAAPTDFYGNAFDLPAWVV
jgi:hypothetical protein